MGTRQTTAFIVPSSPAELQITADDVVAVARERMPVRLSAEAVEGIRTSRERLESVLGDGEPHYGINTGFGSFSRQRISEGDLRDLQRNLIRSHASGLGEPFAAEVVRGMMFLLVCSLSRGLSGVRLTTVQTLVEMLNKGVHPVVPSVGSCGASGDLAPLAHVILAAIGEGQAEFRGRVMDGGKALTAAGIKPIALQAKEGLALINGTHLMAAQGALLVHDFEKLFEAALVAAAMSIDGCRATDAFLDARVHAVGSTPGQAVVAELLRGLLAGSKILPSHVENDPRVQDPYSLRCTPQVLGAVMDAFDWIDQTLGHALQAVTDNPLVFSGKRGATEVVSAGNFHGMPLAIPLDTLAILLSHIAGISERRTYHMLSGFDTEAGLTPFLTPKGKGGLHSGLMIAQYAAAACCNELVGLAMPASVANLSTSAGMEDYNSWGPRAAAKARRGLELARSVVAIELICAAEAVEHHRPLKSSEAVEHAIGVIRGKVKRLTGDRPPAPDIAAVVGLIRDGELAVG